MIAIKHKLLSILRVNKSYLLWAVFTVPFLYFLMQKTAYSQDISNYDLEVPTLNIEINEIPFEEYYKKQNTIENKIDEIDVYALSQYAYALQLGNAKNLFKDNINDKSLLKWKNIISFIAKKYNIDKELIAAIIAVESSFNEKALSNKGAVGLMQLMPDTIHHMNVKEPTNAYENINAGTRYLKIQIERFKNIDYALAAYNAGPENVKKYKGIPPFKETINFVNRVKANYNKLKRDW